MALQLADEDRSMKYHSLSPSLGAGQDLAHQFQAGVRMQEREPPDGLALPLGGWDECDLVLVQPLGPRIVVLGLPAEPAEQHHSEVGFADQFQLRRRLDQLRRLLDECGGDFDGLAVGLQPVYREREP